MYYDLLARFSATVEFLAPRLLRRQVVIPVVVLLIVGVFVAWWVVGIAAAILWFLFALWLLSRKIRGATENARVP